MRLLLTFTTAFLFAALFSILPRNFIIKESKELNYTVVQIQKETTYAEHVIRLWIGKTGESHVRLATNDTMLAGKIYTLYLTNSWVTQS